MKLTTEKIQFIDTYLINNEVIYLDIRHQILNSIALLEVILNK